MDDANDVAVAHLVIESEQQVWGTQVKEMQCMGLQCLPIVHQATHLFCRWCEFLGSDEHVGRLGGRKVMANRTDAA